VKRNLLTYSFLNALGKDVLYGMSNVAIFDLFHLYLIILHLYCVFYTFHLYQNISFVFYIFHLYSIIFYLYCIISICILYVPFVFYNVPFVLYNFLFVFYIFHLYCAIFCLYCIRRIVYFALLRFNHCNRKERVTPHMPTAGTEPGPPVSHNIRSGSCAFRPEPLMYNLGFWISL
jgi:hypothetical protein